VPVTIATDTKEEGRRGDTEVSSTRSGAIPAAPEREGHAAASKKQLARQAHSAARRRGAAARSARGEQGGANACAPSRKDCRIAADAQRDQRRWYERLGVEQATIECGGSPQPVAT
jgi:hypothetical protein